MAYSRLGMKDMQEILSHYDVGQMKYFKALKGHANSNFLIRADKKYVLSVCNEKKGELSGLVKVMLHLEAKNFPSSRIVMDRGGKYANLYQGDFVLLRSYIEGNTPVCMDKHMLHQLGKTIGLLHNLGDLEDIPSCHPYGLSYFGEINDNHPFSDWLKKKEKRLISKIDAGLPRTLTHGDIFPDNTIYEGNVLRAIIDFEETSNYFSIFDIGMAIVGISVLGKVSEEQYKPLIEGYVTERELKKEEITSLNTFISYAAAATAFWRYRQYNLRRPNISQKDSYKVMTQLSDEFENRKFSF